MNIILSSQDIHSLVDQNEKEKKETELLKEKIEEHKNDFLEKPFNRFDLYKSVIIDDMHIDGFVMKYPDGWVVRQSDRIWHFRGESACYPTSQPTFIRKLKNKSKEEKRVFEFVTNLKLFEFFNVLNKLDHYHYFRNLHITIGNKHSFIDVLFYNIAQHYGFDTNLLDITSDFEVALFFACCKYCNNKWLPLTNKDFCKNEESKYGRIFRRRADCYRNRMYPVEKYVVFPVGFQPFMRCHMQYSYAIEMDEDMDLNKSESGFECLKFEQSEKLCNYIYSKMKNGELIYPQEGLHFISGELKQIQEKSQFSLEAFMAVYKNLNWAILKRN